MEKELWFRPFEKPHLSRYATEAVKRVMLGSIATALKVFPPKVVEMIQSFVPIEKVQAFSALQGDTCTNHEVEIHTLGGILWTQGNERMLIAEKNDNSRAIVRFLHRDGFWEVIIHLERHRRIKMKWFCFHFYKLEDAAAATFNIIDKAGYTFIVKK